MKNILILFLLLVWSAAISQEVPELAYACPPCNSHCDQLVFDKAGLCSHCNMQLVLKKDMEIGGTPERKKIAFYLQDGVEVLDFAGPMEVFAYAGYEVFTVSKTKEPIITQGIMKILPEYSIADAPQADILAFFGGNSGAPSNDPEVINWVKSRQGVEYYLSVCTGAFVLAESGILNGKTATTFHDALDHLEDGYPEIKVLKNARFVDNGNVITTAGISAGIDGALHLVAKLQGFNAARKTAYYMEYDKWVPGEGLILAEENPYENFTNITGLEDYIGTYEFRDESEIELKINEREQSLYAVVANRSYPLFYLDKNLFMDLNEKPVTFERGESNEVIGYKLANDLNKVYHKLK